MKSLLSSSPWRKVRGDVLHHARGPSPWRKVRGLSQAPRPVLEARPRYEPNHIETATEFLSRGGTIQRIPAGVSADRLEWSTMVARLLGESAEDVDRGFAWADIDRSVRDHIAGQHRGSFVFDIQEEN